MRFILLAVALLVVSTTVQAQVTCTTYGNETRCQGYDSNGNWVSYTCRTYGNQTTCSSY